MTVTIDQLAVAVNRGILALADDPAMRHYSSDTVAAVYAATVGAMAGAGTMENAAVLVANDPMLADIPVDVVEVIVAASVVCFAKALSDAMDTEP